ncbi:uncharacterized protein LOC111630203 isoform X2 [Centruroides sculpturatus]|uniref:uncharacterized protein LOC111630203 isoform X2 n=1 Tax=Centruroides sculpturatus TaxID=218467 RepID=UPI000C6CBCEA|nr:uncharacterized protein LOC111630203 isoform X2 [Centruroides sculpturatus]
MEDIDDSHNDNKGAFWKKNTRNVPGRMGFWLISKPISCLLQQEGISLVHSMGYNRDLKNGKEIKVLNQCMELCILLDSNHTSHFCQHLSISFVKEDLKPFL